MTTKSVSEMATEAKMKDSAGISEQLAGKVGTYTAGVASVDKNAFVELAPENIREYIPLVQMWEKQFLAGASLAAAMANVGALAGDKSLEVAECTIPMGDNSLVVKNVREMEIRDGLGADAGKKTVYGATKIAYEVDAAATGRGELKRIRTVVGQYATALLS